MISVESDLTLSTIPITLAITPIFIQISIAVTSPIKGKTSHRDSRFTGVRDIVNNHNRPNDYQTRSRIGRKRDRGEVREAMLVDEYRKDCEITIITTGDKIE